MAHLLSASTDGQLPGGLGSWYVVWGVRSRDFTGMADDGGHGRRRHFGDAPASSHPLGDGSLAMREWEAQSPPPTQTPLFLLVITCNYMSTRRQPQTQVRCHCHVAQLFKAPPGSLAALGLCTVGSLSPLLRARPDLCPRRAAPNKARAGHEAESWRP